MACPNPLLILLGRLLQDTDPRRSIPRSISLIERARTRASANLGSYPCDLASTGGAACYQCASWFSPTSSHCPQCRSTAMLAIPTPSPAQRTWLTGYVAQLTNLAPELLCLSPLPAYATYLLLRVALVWLRLVQSNMHRWTRHRIPSVPLITHTHVLCVWLDDPSHLRRPPESMQWHYTAQAAGFHSLCPVLDPPQSLPSDPVLIAPGCPTCGKPSMTLVWFLVSVRHSQEHLNSWN